MDILSIISSFFLTAIAYLAFPLIKLFINGSRFAKNRAHKIALWNSIVLGALFCIITSAVSEGTAIWNGAPAMLYYWINRSILTDENATDESPSEEQIKKSQNRKNIIFKILKGIGALLLGVVSSEMLLLIILGDSVRGTPALILTLLVTIPFFALYFWLFTFHDKKKYEEKSSRPVVTNSPDISSSNEKSKDSKNRHISRNETPKKTPSVDKNISFCRKCGTKLHEDSSFCHKCGTNTVIESTTKETSAKQQQVTPIEKLALLTIGLPAIIADNNEEESNILKNPYAYCEAVIFVEFFIRANALEVAPSKDIAMMFSDTYIEAVISEITNTLPDAEAFFADMFYARATLYDNIVMNSEEPIMDVVEVLTHIIHKELDDDTYITVDNKDFKYFGGIIENLAIKTELVTLFQCVNDCTAEAIQELKEYLITLK